MLIYLEEITSPHELDLDLHFVSIKVKLFSHLFFCQERVFERITYNEKQGLSLPINITSQYSYQ